LTLTLDETDLDLYRNRRQTENVVRNFDVYRHALDYEARMMVCHDVFLLSKIDLTTTRRFS